MADENNLPDEIRDNAVDHTVAGLRAALGMVPLAGSLLAEIAGYLIPRQRVERIADFAAKLEARVGHLEKAQISRVVTDEEFTDLTEEALRQASRATTDERRGYLANLLANSLTDEAISFAETKHLMRLLGELNDVEVVWLRFFAVQTLHGDKAFRDLHANVLQPKRAHIGSPMEDVGARALQESYSNHLLRLGLVQDRVHTGRDGKPEFDRMTGGFKAAYRHTSTLGGLLLRQIGLVPPED